jgi:hemerythrin superfamily protein
MAIGSKIAGKAAGAGKQAMEALAGYPGVFHHLAAEHAEVSILMMRIANSSEESSVRSELFPDLRRKLLAHAHAEEEEFYPQLRQLPELADLVERSLQEHKQIETQLDELEAGDKSSESWTKRFEETMHAVQRHVDLEEDQVFPKAKDLLIGEQADEMLQLVETVEDREKAVIGA